MRAQEIIFDILVTAFGAREKNFEMAIGDIQQDLYKVLGIGGTPTVMMLKAALDLLVATHELETRGPSHDMYSVLYHRPE